MLFGAFTDKRPSPMPARALDTCLSCRSLPGRQTFRALNKVSEKAGGLPSSGFFLFYSVIATFLAVFQARQNRTENSALSDFYSGD